MKIYQIDGKWYVEVDGELDVFDTLDQAVEYGEAVLEKRRNIRSGS